MRLLYHVGRRLIRTRTDTASLVPAPEVVVPAEAVARRNRPRSFDRLRFCLILAGSGNRRRLRSVNNTRNLRARGGRHSKADVVAARGAIPLLPGVQLQSACSGIVRSEALQFQAYQKTKECSNETVRANASPTPKMFHCSTRLRPPKPSTAQRRKRAS